MNSNGEDHRLRQRENLGPREVDGDVLNARRRYLDVLRLVAEVRWNAKGIRELPWWRSLDDNEITMPVEEASKRAVTWSGRPLQQSNEAFRPRLVELRRIFPHSEVLAGGDSELPPL